MMIKSNLDQLISDMHQSALKVPISKVPEGEFDADYRDELEASQEQTMSKWFGLGKELFPPSEMLTSEELNLISDKFEKLWAAYSFYADFPKGLPAKCRYELMGEYLNHSCQYRPRGWKQCFTFCDYEPENCPFGREYCPCKDLDTLFDSLHDDSTHLQ